MASTEIWRDFEQIRDVVSGRFTVDKLKAIITAVNEDCQATLAKTGKKQELINRLSIWLEGLRTSNMTDKWQSARNIINSFRNTGNYVSHNRFATGAQPASFSGVQASTSTFATTTFKAGGYSATAPTAAHRYDPFAPPVASTAAQAAASTSTTSRPIGIRFKESPFFTVEQAVSGIIECPESASAMDRRQQTLTFTLSSDQLAKLKAPNSTYQLRLFCTSSIFYAPNNRLNNYPCPIEFPPTCEVRVNNTPITANLKGLKKKPGTAPAPDLAKYVRLTNQQNRIDMIYVNSTQPVQPKKYYLVVYLVEATTIDKLIENLKANRRRSSEEIRKQMVESANDDDDIQAGPQKMSLKCPLSFSRVTTPCRSSKCVHSQCFDALSWFCMMEQTTTYLCPTCEKTLDHKDLIIDGYFDEILRATDEDVDDVMVEADGEWHTSDNKYASAGWRARHPLAAPKVETPIPTYQPPVNGNQDKGKSAEVYVLSDDDDEDYVKKELSPSTNTTGYRHSLDSVPRSNRSTSHVVEEVIDLTLSDDDEPAPPPPPPAATLKRKAPEVEPTVIDNSWKKQRPDTQEPLPPLPQSRQQTHLPPVQPVQPIQQASISPVYRSPPMSTLDARTHTYDHSHSRAGPPPPPTHPPLNGYHQPPAPSAYTSSYPGRPSLTESRQLPPPSNSLPASNAYHRVPPSSRWPGQ